jgi:hypothetical protein
MRIQTYCLRVHPEGEMKHQILTSAQLCFLVLTQHTQWRQRGSGGIDLHILNFGAGKRWMVSFTHLLTCGDWEYGENRKDLSWVGMKSRFLGLPIVSVAPLNCSVLNFHIIIDPKSHFVFGGKNISLNLTLAEVPNIHNFHDLSHLAENIFPWIPGKPIRRIGTLCCHSTMKLFNIQVEEP